MPTFAHGGLLQHNTTARLASHEDMSQHCALDA